MNIQTCPRCQAPMESSSAYQWELALNKMAWGFLAGALVGWLA